MLSPRRGVAAVAAPLILIGILGLRLAVISALSWKNPERVLLMGTGGQVPTVNHGVRPGITRWAQIKYHCGGGVEESRAKLEYDLYYIKHMSIPLDLGIMVETVKVVFSGRGAK